MPSCTVCDKDYISEDLTTIGNQSVCCLSCVGLLKANIHDACSYCGRPVWKDNYYEIDNSFFCSEKCKNITQERLIKEKGVKYIKFRHFKEEKYYNESPKDKPMNKRRENNNEIINDEENISNEFNKNYFIENNEWNKKSFIQKESNYEDDHNNSKENLKISYKIDVSIHEKNINESKARENNHKKQEEKEQKEQNEQKEQKEQKDTLIKSMKKYFKATNYSIYKNKHKGKKRARNNNQNNLAKNKIIDKEYNNHHNISKPSLPKISKISLNSNILDYNNKYLNKISNLSTRHIYIFDKNPFQIHKETKNYRRNLSIGNDDNNRNNDINDIHENNISKNENNINVNKDDKYYVFNPTRKDQNCNISKRISYPTDSLTFPTDSLPSKNDYNKDSTINCCYLCGKPIIIRNSTAYKEFCSVQCKNEYYKSMKI